jgi:serine/threonine-protein kinase
LTESASTVHVGQILVGKYRVDRVLGAGAMGVVVAAHHLGLDTKVAIKLLQPHMLQDQEVVARFAREARAAAKITNHHVVRVLDVGELDTGAPFMVMEFLEGSDLREWLGHHGPLPVAQAVDFMMQASEAIAEAHRVGIVHRDLKPSNLYCVTRGDAEPSIKVLDFGISKMSAGRSGGQSMAITRTSTVIGTPLYMAPEQMESSRDVDARADLWALGVILYELLAGQSPFFAESFPEVCLKVATRPPPPLRAQRPDVPEALEGAILRCLEKDRDRRYADVPEFCAAIAPFGTGQAAASAERVWRMESPSRRSTRTQTNLDPARDRPSTMVASIGAVWHTKGAPGRPNRQLGIVAGALAIGIAAVIAALAGGKSASQPPLAVPPPAVASVTIPAVVLTPPQPIPSPAAGPSLPEETKAGGETGRVDAGAPILGAKPRKARAAPIPSATIPTVAPTAESKPEPATPKPQVEPEAPAYDERL